MSGATLPALFIGSSREGLPVAQALQELLHYDMEPTIWSDGLFQPTASLLQRLVSDAPRYDLAIFVFAADDRIVLRQNEYAAVRDNVIFESGLFVGTLGLDRCFIVAPFDVHDLRLPSDLLGVVPLPFNSSRSDGNLVAAAGVGHPGDDDFPRAALLRVFAFLESVSDGVLAGRLPEQDARGAFSAALESFWPHAAVLLSFPGEAQDHWDPPPRIAELYTKWRIH